MLCYLTIMNGILIDFREESSAKNEVASPGRIKNKQKFDLKEGVYFKYLACD